MSMPEMRCWISFGKKSGMTYWPALTLARRFLIAGSVKGRRPARSANKITPQLQMSAARPS